MLYSGTPLTESVINCGLCAHGSGSEPVTSDIVQGANRDSTVDVSVKHLEHHVNTSGMNSEGKAQRKR